MRIPGVIVGFCVFLMFVRNLGLPFEFKKAVKQIGFGLLAISGIATYCTYLYFKTSNPIIFVTSQSASGWAGRFGVNDILIVFNEAFDIKRFLAGNFGQFKAFSLILIPTSLGLMFYFRKKIDPIYLIFCGLILIPSIRGWSAFSRYILVIFPLFLMAGELLNRIEDQRHIRYVMISIMTIFTTINSLFYFVS